MGRVLILFWVVTAGTFAGCKRTDTPVAQPPEQAPADPAAQLQGEWEAVEGEFQGEAVHGPGAEAFLSQFRFTFRGDTFTSVSPRGTMRGTFSIDGSATPMRMRMLKETGDEVAAIIEFRGGRLYFCATAPGDPPPTEFKTKPGSSALFSVYEWVR